MFEGVKPNTVIIMAWLSLFVTFYRFGFLVEYLSQATIVGFLAAAAVGIGLQQLKGLFGIDNFNNKTDLFSVVKSLWTSFKNQVRKVQFRWKLNRPLNLIHYNSKFFIINFASCLIINYFFSLTFLQSAWHPYNLIIGFSFLCFILFTRFLVSNVLVVFFVLR